MSSDLKPQTTPLSGAERPPPVPRKPLNGQSMANRPPKPWDASAPLPNNPSATAPSLNLNFSHDTPQIRVPQQPSSTNGSVDKELPMRLRKNVPVQTRASPPAAAPQVPDNASSTRLSKEPPAHILASRSMNNVSLLPSEPVATQHRVSSMQPPASEKAVVESPNRHVSASAISAPATASHAPSAHGRQSPTNDEEKRGRRSWLSGFRSKSSSKEPAAGSSGWAWILGQNTDYNTSYLAKYEKVPELWNESGTVYVYLQPEAAGVMPSFKVPAYAVNESVIFTELIEADIKSSGSSGSSLRYSPTQSGVDGFAESRLFLSYPVSSPGKPTAKELERLVQLRNMFAFLTGQPLVATKTTSSMFEVFLGVAGLLKDYQFTHADGFSFGDAVNMSFGFFLEQFALADVRFSREKTIEALILGERMCSLSLYNEAFAHAVGKYAALRDLNSPWWDMISATTRERLERGHLELVNRQNNVNNRLEAFEFPALFSGVANSTALTEYKDVKFATWRKSFARMRQLVLSHYKTQFGSWPPKARSKKNPFSESGLNRQVLKILYADMCELYDLLVDRESITTRGNDQSTDEEDIGNPHVSAMRKVMAEFDMSSPPVLPPIPFDIPKLPDMAAVKENFHELSAKEQSKLEKSLQDYQMLLILNKSYNFDVVQRKSQFINEFMEFEKKEAKGRTTAEMADQRLGTWLFLYVIIQSLPMLVVDAPGLGFSEGVEYFLCQPPKGQPPWMGDAPAIRKRWYEVAGGGGLVELSTDAVEFSIEGTYHRSHCWEAARRWEMEGKEAPPPPVQDGFSPLPPPQGVFTDMDPGVPGRAESPPSGPPGAALRPRSGSPANRSSYRSSVALGLEPVAMQPSGSLPGSRAPSLKADSPTHTPIQSRSSSNLHGLAAPPPIQTQAHSRSGSRPDSAVTGSTFDDILKGMEQPKKKKGGFF